MTPERVLVAGFATRHVAQSACRAGYEVYAVDHFCDQDLRWYTKECRTFEELDDLPDCVAAVCRDRRIDMLVVASGAEAIGATVPLCGTAPAKVARFLDKMEIQRFFEDLQVPVPPLAPDGVYPAMLKPRRGAGGWRNAVVRSDAARRAWEEAFPDDPAVAQQVVEGMPASVSCIADGTRAVAIATNEQILRGQGASAHGFAGSITPVDHPLSGQMIAVAERIAAASGCVGSVGIDFVLGSEPWAIEINPRFQATLDTVEAAIGMSVFQLHVDACRGTLPAKRPVQRRVAVRRILFADRDMAVGADLAPLAPAVADIPWPGTEIEEGHAVISVYGSGATRDEALTALGREDERVRRLLGM
ncbi:ATP-grasp domain-containing protein [Methanoculleus sp. FWC-SCC1]|uniref:ATP-grasp domain-containing protein n=1 Tax=Methanoculleus frigidifontis TaxID=2584085 RepID=A0ABT8M963_9EURY|nr:ATP-grasp domain-containing protein [Methanoculleus sp. FWC-SCC1]MDN7024463.1 ATP-grasp domain-containing protein [Methanoculleus sp. FWC-SCC1]